MQIACGDFNIDLLNENLAARITLENLMTAQGLELVSLRQPTRETATSSTCIDSIYSNIPVQLTQIKKTTFSDHYSLELSFEIFYEIAESIFEYRSLKKLEDSFYCEKFLFFLNHSLGKINEQDSDAESYLEEIAHVIKDSTDKYFPTKQVKRHEPKKSWITNRIKRHIANRDKHYHLWLKTKSSVDYEKYRKKEMKSIWQLKTQSGMKFNLELTTIIRENFSDT